MKNPEDMTEHERLYQLVKRLPTDYSGHGGSVVRDDEPDCSWGCQWARKLSGGLGSDWVVCTNPRSPRVGLLTFEHQAGAGCFESYPPCSCGGAMSYETGIGRSYILNDRVTVDIDDNQPVLTCQKCGAIKMREDEIPYWGYMP